MEKLRTQVQFEIINIRKQSKKNTRIAMLLKGQATVHLSLNIQVSKSFLLKKKNC